MKHRGNWIVRIVGALAALLVVLLPRILWARAGGGGNFSGGGHGGGHGGGSGGWFFLVQLLLDYPAVGIPVILIVVGGAIYYYYNQSSQAASSRQAAAQKANSSALAVLCQADPAFEPNAFLQRARMAFDKIQSAWCAQNLQYVRAFISDGVHERFSLQFSEQKQLGYRDQMENISVEEMAIVEVASQGLFDELSVRFRARAADFRVSIADGRRVSGSTSVQPFAEVWSFLRRRGAQTTAGKTGLIEGNCPNCGSPIELNESANCANCKALLRSGQYDWVLCEITQESEWERFSSMEIHGVPALRQSDPEFNIYALQDRASVIFWRKASADRTGRIQPLAKIALPEFCNTYAGRLKAAEDGQRQFLAECGVGAVVLRGIVGDNDGDRSIVAVRWSGKHFVETGGQLHNTNQDSLRNDLFVLYRKKGVKTDAGKSISSAHCPQCGAPNSGGAGAGCEFCGAVLNDGSLDWVLEGIEPMSDPRAQSILHRLLTDDAPPPTPWDGPRPSRGLGL